MGDGQGSLEYLLLVGGAIVVSVIVLALLLGIGDAGGDGANSTTATLLCQQQASFVGVNDCTAQSPALTVVVGPDCYTCVGSAPNCTASMGCSSPPVCNYNGTCDPLEDIFNCPGDCGGGGPSGGGVSGCVSGCVSGA